MCVYNIQNICKLNFLSRFISCVDILNDINNNNEKKEEEYPVSIISISNVFDNSLMELRELAKMDEGQGEEQLQKREEDTRWEEVSQTEKEERRGNGELDTGEAGEVREQHPEQR